MKQNECGLDLIAPEYDPIRSYKYYRLKKSNMVSIRWATLGFARGPLLCTASYLVIFSTHVLAYM